MSIIIALTALLLTSLTIKIAKGLRGKSEPQAVGGPVDFFVDSTQRN